MKKILSIIMIIFIAVTIFTGCKLEPEPVPEPEPVTHDFNSPQEYLDNPDVRDTIKEQSFPINLGTTPPSIEGIYSMSGTVVDTNMLGISIGTPMASTIKFYNQTIEKIDLKETDSYGQTAYASGNFIIGEYGYFTTLQEAQIDEPNGDGYIRAVAFLSGQKLANGDIKGESLTIILEAVGTDKVKAGDWYKGDLIFALK